MARKFSTWLAAATLAAVASIGSAQADATNPGFESGLSGWTSYGSAGTSSSMYGYSSQFGSNFGYVQTGAGTNVYSTLSQTFSLLAGQVFSGYVGFKTNDYMPFNDKAILTVSDGETLTSLWSATVSAVGNFGSTGWVPFSFTAATSGLYTLNLGVKNVGDNGVASYAFLDARPAGTTNVPGPIAGAGLPALFGLLGFASWRRRQRTAA